jgi:hypothetical protein
VTDTLMQVIADAREEQWQEVAEQTWPSGDRPILTHPDAMWFLFDWAWAYRVGIHPASISETAL